ncbi:TolC family outer membrane protein [Azonexus sp.]|uniref:TolC family outer membrane protein n=1 Tax=Azonexus sp. TaxID=1872668 RepID=UPI0035AF345F
MKQIAWLLATSLTAAPLHAADLARIYRDAQDNDPVYAAARATRDAGREKAPQGLAGLLPTVSVSGNTVWNDVDSEPRNAPTAASNAQYNTNAYQLTLSQPLFRWQNWVAYGQAKQQVAQAEATFQQASQDLILRVAQAYFDVLYASENLTAVRANKEAIAQQLELAKKSFEVGTSTITDTHEAQARFDLVQAQEIAAESELEVRRQALQTLIGQDAGKLAPPRKDAVLAPPEPNRLADWVAAAEKDALAVQIQQAQAEIAAREVDKQRAGHYPTLDLVANRGKSKAYSSAALGAVDTDFANYGLQLNIPLFQGGSTTSRQREAAANSTAARFGLEAARRNAALAARQYYLGVTNGLAQVNALKAALVSSQSALESNKLGYEVGVRINIDVLNAENQVYVTRRDLAKATFDTLMAQLRLKAAVGALGEDDVTKINALLDDSAAQ